MKPSEVSLKTDDGALMPRLELLGSVVLEDDDGPVQGAAARRHPLALLALLACAPGGTLDRGKLVGLLWPEIPEDRARTRLNTHLYQIRRRLGGEVLASAGDRVRLDPGALACDVRRFREAVDAGRFERAVELYGGPFMDGFRPPGAAAFEKWMDRERDRLARAYREALEELAERDEGRGEPAAAARWWRERANEDPYDSRVIRRLMEAHAAAGNRAEALRVARVHARLLEQELGTGPDAEVRELVERLEAGEGKAPAGDHEAPAAARAPGDPPPDEFPSDGPGPARSSPVLAGGGAGGGSGAAGGRRRLAIPPFALRGLAGLLLLAAVAVAGWRLLAGGDDGSDGPGGEPTVAVLPFDNLSPDPENAYFAAGIHEEILTRLARVDGIRLISRTSVLRYGDTEKSLPEIAEELGVAAVLEGSVQRVGEEVRIAVQLNDARADEHLWAESYDRRLSDIFQIQTDVATRIVEELRGVLTAEEQAELARRPTENLEAYVHYLRGHELRGRYFASQRQTRAAAGAYRRAVELDSTFAAAWARLVEARLWLAWIRREFDERERARAALERLERLAPDSPHLRFARGLWLYRGEERYREALQEFEALAELWPGDVAVMKWRARLYRILGRWEEALRTLEQIFELDPADAALATELAWTYLVVRRYEEAERYARLAVTREPGDPFIWGFLIWTHLAQGDTAAARSVVDSAGRHVGDEMTDSRWAWGWALYRYFTGGTGEVLELYREHPLTYTTFPDLGLAVAAAEGDGARVRTYADTLEAWARRMLASAPEAYGEVRSQALLHLALVEAYLGRAEEAVRLADEGVRRYPVSRNAFGGPDRVLWQAHVLTVVGRHEAAVDRLRYLLSVPANMVTVPQLRMDLRWDPLRDRPDFQALLRGDAP